MSVAARLYAGFGLVLALLVGVTGIALVKVDRIEQALRANTEIHVQVQRYAINFRGSAHDRSIAVRDLVLSPTQAARDKEIATIASLAEFYKQSAAPLERLITRPEADPKLGELYADIQDKERQAVATTFAVVSQVNAGDAAAARTLWEKAKPQYVDWLAAINALIDFKEARIQKTNLVAIEQAGSFLGVMFGALLLSLILSGAVAWTVSRSIIRQLGAEPADLAEVGRQVAQGDLQPVALAAQAPRGSVLASLGTMQASLARVVGKVRHASDAVTRGSQDIADGNAGLMRRTEEQAVGLQQAALSMERMTTSVRETAHTAQKATQLAAAASATAQAGGAVVAQVVSTMEEIAASSHQITDIVGVIDSIAFQTNILALNAAVEAARAGTGGRGFAVVAGEVRALAQRSAGAAKEIKDLIDSSKERVEQGARFVRDAGGTMNDIVAQAQRVADLIAEISHATVAQTDGITQVGEVVAHLDRATQQNAAMVEQSAVAARVLRQQAAELAEAVSVFRMSTSSGAPVAEGAVHSRMVATIRGLPRPVTASGGY